MSIITVINPWFFIDDQVGYFGDRRTLTHVSVHIDEDHHLFPSVGYLVSLSCGDSARVQYQPGHAIYSSSRYLVDG